MLKIILALVATAVLFGGCTNTDTTYPHGGAGKPPVVIYDDQ